MQNPKVDLEMAGNFIEALAGDREAICVFQVIFEDKKALEGNSARKKDAFSFSGSLTSVAAKLESFNSKGYGVFVTVNDCVGPRKNANIKKIRAFFSDDDHGKIIEPPIKPTLIVQSGRGAHFYWMTKGTVAVNKFSDIQKRIASTLNTDSSISDLARLMRLPGFIHRKDSSCPKIVKLIERNNLSYSLDEILAVFPERLERAKTNSAPKNVSNIRDVYAKWCLALPKNEGVRNDTAVKIVYEGLGLKLSNDIIAEELRLYCDRSGLPHDEVGDLISRISNNKDAKEIRSLFVNRSGLNISLLTEEYLESRGHYKFSKESTFLYWRDNHYEYTGSYYRKVEQSDLDGDLTQFLKTKDLGKRSLSQILREVKAHLKGVRHIHSSIEPGCHLIKTDYVGFFISLKNQLITVSNGGDDMSVLSTDPDLFSLSAINSDYIKGADCPTWLRLVNTILPDQESVRFIQEWIGYLLTHSTHQAKAVVIYGAGANGKSVLTTVITCLLGEPNVSSVSLEAFNPNRTFTLATTIGKLANICDEMGSVKGNIEAILKQYIGGSPMNLERKGKDSVSVRPTARLTFTTNELPKFSDMSNGLWRRIIIIPVTNQILDEKAQDKRFIDINYWKNNGELPGILNWALEGLQRLLVRGCFEVPKIANEFNKEYRKDSDHALRFFDECVAENSLSRVGTSSLYREYCLYVSNEGGVPVSQANFSQVLMRHFPKVQRAPNPLTIEGKKQRVWVGIELNPGAF